MIIILRILAYFIFSLVLVQADRPQREWSIKCFGPPPSGLPSGLTLQKVCAKPEYNERSWLQSIREGNADFVGLNGYCFPRLGVRAVRPYLLPVSFEIPASLAYGSFPVRLAQLCRDRCWCDSWYRLAGADLSQDNSVQPMGVSHAGVIKKATSPQLAHILDIDDDNNYNTLEEISFGTRYSQILTGRQLEEQADPNQIPTKQVISLHKSNMIECSKSSLDQPIDMRTVSSALGVPPPYDTFIWRSIRKLCATGLSGGDPHVNAGMYCSKNTAPPTLDGIRMQDVSFSDDITPRAEWTLAQNFEFSIRVRAFCFESCWCAREGQATAIKRHKEILQSGWKLGPKITVVKSVDANGKTKINLKSGKSPTKSFFGRFSPKPKTGQCSASLNSGKCPTKDPCMLDGEDICASKPWPVDELGPIPNMRTETIEDVSLTCGQSCEGPAARYCGASERGANDCKCVYLTPSLRQYLDGMTSVSLSASDAGSQIVAFCLSLSYLKNERTPRIQGIGKRDISNDVGGRPEELISCMCNATYVSAGCCSSDNGLVWGATGLKL